MHACGYIRTITIYRCVGFRSITSSTNLFLLISRYWTAAVPPMATFRTASMDIETVRTDAAIALFYSIRIPNSTVNDIHNTRSYEEENYIRKVPEGLIMVERLNLSSLTPSSLLDLVFVCRWVPYGKQLSLLSK